MRSRCGLVVSSPRVVGRRCPVLAVHRLLERVGAEVGAPIPERRTPAHPGGGVPVGGGPAVARATRSAKPTRCKTGRGGRPGIRCAPRRLARGCARPCRTPTAPAWAVGRRRAGRRSRPRTRCGLRSRRLHAPDPIRLACRCPHPARSSPAAGCGRPGSRRGRRPQTRRACAIVGPGRRTRPPSRSQRPSRSGRGPVRGWCHRDNRPLRRHRRRIRRPAAPPRLRRGRLGGAAARAGATPSAPASSASTAVVLAVVSGEVVPV